MSTESSFGADFIETTDEEGQVHIFEKIDEYEVDGKRYALLIYQAEEDVENPPANGNSGDHVHSDDCDHGHSEEVVIMRIIEEDGSQVFEAIDDEDEFQRVVKEIEHASLVGEGEAIIDFTGLEADRED